jgi:hypothetical protein
MDAGSTSQTASADTLLGGILDAGMVGFSDPTNCGPRYDVGELLGRGGMGKVQVCRDRRIGREVARKTMLVSLPADLTRRFVREAIVQARLEHPAFVPVYDVATEDDGSFSFTMRRVRGTTLRALLHPTAIARPGRHRLLSALSQLCLAVHYAHTRGVTHRDIKPDNVMFGEFGEVYLLDWGIARISGEVEDVTEGAVAGHTQAGAILGTLGYMPPEQLRGDHAQVGPAADIYALGAVLFEILAGEPLHRGASEYELTASTLSTHERRPSERAGGRGIPADLDDVVARAIAFEASSRFPSARALGEAIELHLDGERDQAARRAHASRLADSAEAALGAAAGEPSARVSAGRAAVRALALDPQNPSATEVLIRVLGEAPQQAPAEAQMEVERTRRTAEANAIAAFGRQVMAYVPFLLAMFFALGIRSGWMVAAALGATGVAGAALARTRPGVRQDSWIDTSFALHCLANAILTRWASPWIIIPAVMQGNIILLTLYASRRERVIRLVLGVGVIFVPVMLEQLGWIRPSFEISSDGMHVFGSLGGYALWPLVLHTIVLFVAGASLLTGVMNRARELELRLATYSWTLREVVGARR